MEGIGENSHNRNQYDFDTMDIEREFLRQSRALHDVASRRRKGTIESNKSSESSMKEFTPDIELQKKLSQDDESNGEDIQLNSALHSRYKSDFVELGVLGKGGFYSILFQIIISISEIETKIFEY